jgi:hypothetical protein
MLVYYGLRNPPRHTHSMIPVPPELQHDLRSLDGTRTFETLPARLREHPLFAELVEQGVVVDIHAVRRPATSDSHQTCTRCVANDYLLPGLEFDDRGLCALCRCYERAETAGVSNMPRESATDEELRSIAAWNRNSRFDVMVLCTGGKDSTFLLWYLAKKLGLRVLAASWNMPYTNETCRQNLRRSLALLPDVEFVERTLPWNLVRRAMQGQFQAVGLPCLCPVAAHALFYPLAFQEKIPLVMHGVEEVQLAVMSYVISGSGTASKIKETRPDHRTNTLQFLRSMTDTAPVANPFGLGADFVRYKTSVRRVLDPIFKPLDEILARAEKDPDLPIPHLRRLETNVGYGSWAQVVELIRQEMDWHMPPGQKGLLHTSCRIETVKDWCQFKRFQAMRSTSLPQSVVELSAGVYFGLVSREDGLAELSELGYMQEPGVLAPLLEDLGIDRETARDFGEMPWSLGCCAMREV